LREPALSLSLSLSLDLLISRSLVTHLMAWWGNADLVRGDEGGALGRLYETDLERGGEDQESRRTCDSLHYHCSIYHLPMSDLHVVCHVVYAAGAAAPPPPPPAAVPGGPPPPPAPAAVVGGGQGDGRSALLGAISGFTRAALKKADTNDKSGLIPASHASS
jgi:hypothetical protein